MACDQTNAFSILLNQSNLDKIIPMTKYSIMGVAGPRCDAENFSQYICKNLQLYHYTSNHHSNDDDDEETKGHLSMHGQVHFTRNILATALRRGPYQVNILYGGIDPLTKKASLYFLDYLAALKKVNFGAQGYAAYFCLSVLDHAYTKTSNETTLQDAISMINQCILELKTRFLISQPNFLIKVVDENGIRIVSQGSDPTDT